MNKTKIFICVLLLTIVLCGCDLYVYQQPHNYDNSTWVCDEAQITYYVEGSRDNKFNSYAIANIDDQETVLSFWFRSSRIYMCKREENGLDSTEEFLVGDCRYSNEKFIVTISEDEDKLFAGKYKTLTFNRVN